MAAPWTRLGPATVVLAVSAPSHAPAQDAAQDSAAPGDGPTPGRDLGAGLAAQAVAVAVAACAGRGWPVTAAAVDRAGQAKALPRGDGAVSRGRLRRPSLRGIAARSFADIIP